MSEPAERIIDFILREIVRRPGVQIDVDTPLVSSGLIDSLALVEILHQVAEVTNLRIPAGKVQARDMDTVRLMLATAARVGKPRQ
ncbi:MAG TPA: acyl carrier protein [Terriglobales bacterium]|nr:acyl carrier protein [Terriglobales bacterium]